MIIFYKKVRTMPTIRNISLSFFILCVILFVINLYFLRILRDDRDFNLKSKSLSDPDKYFSIVINDIKLNTKQLRPVYINKNPRWFLLAGKLIIYLRRNSNFLNVSEVWNHTYNWVYNDNKLHPAYDSRVGSVLEALHSTNIIKSELSTKGTQLKVLITLEGGQRAIFKPKWYDRETIIPGPVYSGKDRHNAEVVGFILANILNFRSTPITVGRKISLKNEIFTTATDALKETMFTKEHGPDHGTHCLFGKCFYCTRSENVCDTDGFVEGAVILYINSSNFIKKYRSPWQRTYKPTKAPWETNDDYCSLVKDKLTETRLLDLIDASIFDFLIQNGDRHHYETINERVLLMDNGKGLGNPDLDHIDILAPLYQCCIIRNDTWNRLLLLSGGALSETMATLLKNDPIMPVTTPKHLEALDRRLLLIYSTVNICIDKYRAKIFK